MTRLMKYEYRKWSWVKIIQAPLPSLYFMYDDEAFGDKF